MCHLETLIDTLEKHTGFSLLFTELLSSSEAYVLSELTVGHFFPYFSKDLWNVNRKLFWVGRVLPFKLSYSVPEATTV